MPPLKQRGSRKKLPPATRRLPRRAREGQLLDVALLLFIEQGYQGTSIEDIATAAGVTRPIVYKHFGSKDGVYLACLRRARAELDRRIGGASAHKSLKARVHAAITGYFGFVESNRDAWRLLFGGGVAVAGPAAEEARQLRFATVRRIVELFAGAMVPIDPHTREALAHATSGAGEQLAKWWMQNPGISQARMVEHLMGFVWPGLRQYAA